MAISFAAGPAVTLNGWLRLDPKPLARMGGDGSPSQASIWAVPARLSTIGSPEAAWKTATPLVVILVEGSTSLGSSHVLTYTRELVVVTTFQKASVILTVALNPTPAA